MNVENRQCGTTDTANCCVYNEIVTLASIHFVCCLYSLLNNVTDNNMNINLSSVYLCITNTIPVYSRFVINV